MKSSYIMPVLIAFLLCGSSAFAAKAFQMPSDEVIKEIAQNPEKLKDLIAGTTEDQAAQIMVVVIAAMESAGLSDAAIQANVLVMLNAISELRGQDFTMTVLGILRKKVNPRLLPPLPPGSSPPPGTSPKYRRQ